MHIKTLFIMMLISVGLVTPVSAHAQSTPSREAQRVNLAQIMAEDVYAIFGAAYTYISRQNMNGLDGVAHDGFLSDLRSQGYYGGALENPLGMQYRSRVAGDQLEIVISAGDRSRAETLVGIVPNGRITGSNVVVASLPHPSQNNSYSELVGRFHDPSRPFRQVMDVGVSINMNNNNLNNVVSSQINELRSIDISADVLSADSMRFLQWLNISGIQIDYADNALQINSSGMISSGLINAMGDIVGDGGTISDVSTLSAGTIIATNIESDISVAEGVDVETITSSNASIDALSADQASISEGVVRSADTMETTLQNASIEQVSGREMSAVNASLNDAQVNQAIIYDGLIDNATGGQVDFTNALASSVESIDIRATMANVGDIEGDSLAANELNSSTAFTDMLFSLDGNIDSLSGGSLSSDTAVIESLTANQATIQMLETPLLTSGNIATTNIETETASVEQISTQSLSAVNLESHSLGAQNISATTAEFNNLNGSSISADNALIGNARTSQLNADSADFGQLAGEYIDFESANINRVSIQNTQVNEAFIENADGVEVRFDNASIDNVGTETLTATSGDVGLIQGDEINFSDGNFNLFQSEQAKAQVGQFDRITGDSLSVTEASLIDQIRVNSGTIDDVSITNQANTDRVVVDNLTANTAEFSNVASEEAVIEGMNVAGSLIATDNANFSSQLTSSTAVIEVAANGDSISTETLYADNVTTVTLTVPNVSQVGTATAQSVSISGVLTSNIIEAAGLDVAGELGIGLGEGGNISVSGSTESFNASFSDNMDVSSDLIVTGDVFSTNSSINQNYAQLSNLRSELDDCIESEACFPTPEVTLICLGGSCQQEDDQAEYFTAELRASTTQCGNGCSFAWAIPSTFTAVSGCRSGNLEPGESLELLPCRIRNTSPLENASVSGNILFNTQTTGRRRASDVVNVSFENTNINTPGPRQPRLIVDYLSGSSPDTRQFQTDYAEDNPSYRRDDYDISRRVISTGGYGCSVTHHAGVNTYSAAPGVSCQPEIEMVFTVRSTGQVLRRTATLTRITGVTNTDPFADGVFQHSCTATGMVHVFEGCYGYGTTPTQHTNIRIEFIPTLPRTEYFIREAREYSGGMNAGFFGCDGSTAYINEPFSSDRLIITGDVSQSIGGLGTGVGNGCDSQLEVIYEHIPSGMTRTVLYRLAAEAGEGGRLD